MSIFDASDDRGIKVAPSHKQPHGVYVMVYHQTLSIEEALELAREINRVAFNQEQLRSKGYEAATGCCARCKHLLEAHEEIAPGGRPLTVCTVKGCNCEIDGFRPEPKPQISCKRCGAALEDCYCMGGPR